MKKTNSKILSAVLVVALLFSFTHPTFVHAATFSNISDSMTNQSPSATSDHTITWTQGTGHATTDGDTITIAFPSGDFTASASSTWENSDFALTDSAHLALAPVSSCSSDNYMVSVSGITQPTFTITFCSGWSSPTTGSSITFKIFGTAAVGNGTLTNSAVGFNSAPVTITDTGSNTDSGIFAVAVTANGVVTVTTIVNPILIFNVGLNAISLGTLSSASTAAATTTIDVSSNAAGGFAVVYNGPTLTSASSTIAAYASPSAATPGIEGFGINLVSNSAPSVGSNAIGTGCAAGVQSDYSTANQFTWKASTPTTLATVTSPSSCSYTVSYVANIAPITPSGNYSSATTYLATGTF